MPNPADTKNEAARRIQRAWRRFASKPIHDVNPEHALKELQPIVKEFLNGYKIKRRLYNTSSALLLKHLKEQHWREAFLDPNFIYDSITLFMGGKIGKEDFYSLIDIWSCGIEIDLEKATFITLSKENASAMPYLFATQKGGGANIQSKHIQAFETSPFLLKVAIKIEPEFFTAERKGRFKESIFTIDNSNRSSGVALPYAWYDFLYRISSESEFAQPYLLGKITISQLEEYIMEHFSRPASAFWPGIPYYGIHRDADAKRESSPAGVLGHDVIVHRGAPSTNQTLSRETIAFHKEVLKYIRSLLGIRWTQFLWDIVDVLSTDNYFFEGFFVNSGYSSSSYRPNSDDTLLAIAYLIEHQKSISNPKFINNLSIQDVEKELLTKTTAIEKIFYLKTAISYNSSLSGTKKSYVLYFDHSDELYNPIIGAQLVKFSNNAFFENNPQYSRERNGVFIVAYTEKTKPFFENNWIIAEDIEYFLSLSDTHRSSYIKPEGLELKPGVLQVNKRLTFEERERLKAEWPGEKNKDIKATATEPTQQKKNSFFTKLSSFVCAKSLSNSTKGREPEDKVPAAHKDFKNKI